MSVRIGIDLGGTKTELVALNQHGEQCYRTRVPTPAYDYQAIIATIVRLVREAEHALGTRASVGIGTPGSPSPSTYLMRNANTQCLNGKPLARDLNQALERDILIANDANCFALSEAVDGAARDARVVFGVIIGTGTGGGVIIDRQPLTGRNAITGECGHNPLPWPSASEQPGPACFCGKHGCIETFVSGPAMARDHELHTGETMDASRIGELAATGEARTMATLDRYLDRLARALASVINILDPDVIVLGGGVSRIDSLYSELPRRLPAYVFSDSFTTPIVPALYGDASGVRGAAWLWPGS